MTKNALPVFVEPFEAQNNLIEATIETQTYSTELTTCLFLNTTTSPMSYDYEGIKQIYWSTHSEPAEEHNKRDLPIMAEGRLIDVLCVTHRQMEGGGETASATWQFDIYCALRIMINLNNLSNVDTIGLHIPPTALKYRTPVLK